MDGQSVSRINNHAALTGGYFSEVDMREIKFRIWDGNNENYDYPEMLELNKGLEYEQFTGLHDKNGVEIYEGDIVLHECLPGAKNGREVVFENMVYKIKGKMLSDDIILCDNSNRYITVIGNIHEGANQ